MIGKVAQKGITLVPLKLYFREGNAKILIAVARGRVKSDKRQRISEEEARREMKQAADRYKG